MSIVGLTGIKNNHLEFSVGVTGFELISSDSPPEPDDFRALPAFTLGYRYQKYNGGFIYRVGIGFPEIVYIGIGHTF